MHSKIGSEAGLKKIDIINEPSAAAISYFYDDDCKLKETIQGKIIVIDLGGGTFDISIITMTAKECETPLVTVEGSWGDANLGGQDFTNELYKYCLSLVQGGHESMPNDDKIALKKECEALKIRLSNSKSSPIRINGKIHDINQSKYEELIKKYLIQIQDTLKEALTQGCCFKSQVVKVLLVGSATKTKAVQDLVKEFFKDEIKNNATLISETEDADTSIARGATIYSHFLNNGKNELQLLDVTPLSLG